MTQALRGSLRFRLTAWYSLSLAVLLSAFAALAYGVIHQRLMHYHDGLLRAASREALGVLAEQGSGDTLSPAQKAKLDQIGRLLIVHEDPGRDHVFYLSPEMEGSPLAHPLSDASWKSQTDPWFDILEDQEGKPWRIFSRPYQTRAGQHGVICATEDLGDIDTALDGFRNTLLLLMPLGLLCSTAGGYWLSGRALKPVERITAMAREIEARSLDRRLPHPGTNDEIGRLVETLNHMMDRLEASFEGMKRFTADASHELRSPLANLRSLVDVSLSLAGSSQEQQETILGLGEEIQRLSRIVEDLLLLAKADADRLPLRPEPLSLGRIAEGQAEAFAARAEESGIGLKLGPVAPGPIRGDEHWIYQLVANLVDNALKFTPRGGQVTLSVAEEEGHARLCVEDSGPGLPEEDLPKVFERFYRCDPARSHAQAPGSGLGLAIASWIAQAHGATIQAENRPEGGARFTVRFPLSRQDAATALG